MNRSMKLFHVKHSDTLKDFLQSDSSRVQAKIMSCVPHAESGERNSLTDRLLRIFISLDSNLHLVYTKNC
jgi:hypothetical protein